MADDFAREELAMRRLFPDLRPPLEPKYFVVSSAKTRNRVGKHGIQFTSNGKILKILKAHVARGDLGRCRFFLTHDGAGRFGEKCLQATDHLVVVGDEESSRIKFETVTIDECDRVSGVNCDSLCHGLNIPMAKRRVNCSATPTKDELGTLQAEILKHQAVADAMRAELDDVRLGSDETDMDMDMVDTEADMEADMEADTEADMDVAGGGDDVVVRGDDGGAVAADVGLQGVQVLGEDLRFEALRDGVEHQDEKTAKLLRAALRRLSDQGEYDFSEQDGSIAREIDLTRLRDVLIEIERSEGDDETAKTKDLVLWDVSTIGSQDSGLARAFVRLDGTMRWRQSCSGDPESTEPNPSAVQRDAIVLGSRQVVVGGKKRWTVYVRACCGTDIRGFVVHCTSTSFDGKNKIGPLLPPTYTYAEAFQEVEPVLCHPHVMVTSSDEAELLTGGSEGMNITKIKAITGYKESTRTKTLKSGRTKETKVLRTSPGGQWIRVSYSDASGVAGHLDVTRREYDAAASILRLIHDGRAVGADSSLDSRLSTLALNLTHSLTHSRCALLVRQVKPLVFSPSQDSARRTMALLLRMRERRIVQTEETVRKMEWAVTPGVKEECEKCREAMIESIGRLKYVERSV